MENKSSNEYVAQLLKQLDELKRKKALKERKLQKLKTSSTVDHLKEQTSRITHALFLKTHDQLLYENSSKSVSADDESHQYENCSLNVSECTKADCVKTEKYKENCIKNSYASANVDQLKLKRNSIKDSELDAPICNRDIHDRKYIVETVNSHCPSFEKNNCKRLKNSHDIFAVPSSEKSFLHGENGSKKSCLKANLDLLSQDHASGRTDKCYIEVNRQKCSENELNIEETESNKDNRKTLLPKESERIDIGGHFTGENSICNGSKKDNKSNKSLSGKEKSCDILNESLNSNMSCFLSAEFFPVDDNTQELVFENKSLMQCIHENTKQIETSEHVVVSSHSVIPDTACKKTQQNNLDNFNFPKFSTPTDGINFVSSSDENIKSQNKPAEQNASVVSDVQTLSSTTEYICSVNKTSKDYTDTKNIFDPAQVSLIIGKGLCSVLDAHYVSPKKSTELKNVSSSINSEEINSQNKVVFKERFSDKMHEKSSSEYDKYIIMAAENFEGTDELFGESVNCTSNSFLDVQSQVTKTVCGLVNKVCEDSENVMNIKMDTRVGSTSYQNSKADSETLVIPETEGLGLCISDNFLETSTLSENLNDFHTKDNLLNVSSQSRLESPVVNKIISAVKSARDSSINNNVVTSHPKDVKGNGLTEDVSTEVEEKISDYHLDNTTAMETSLLGDDTQELGNYKQVPYMNKNDAEYRCRPDNKTESNLNFVCSLQGVNNEAVLDVEIVPFGNVKYAFIQHKTEIHVWCQAKKKEWIKIFNHAIEDMFSLVKICMTKDEENLVIVMLLSNGEQYCLQFLLFEKDVKVIKLMENTHWLEKRHSSECVLLCGLEGLMFASAQPISGHEVSLHAFISLKESPRLMTAVLGSTGSTLYSLCKINNLPNALMGINDSMLYVWYQGSNCTIPITCQLETWHILEARLVTAVTLHPHDYLPIRSCFWATVENGLIYLLTTCEGTEKHLACQLLAANLATGFCQTAMKFSSQPSRNEVFEISKAVYMEPFLVVCNSKGALMWSITDEHCCAALSSKSGTTSVTISSDYENWGIIAVGSRQGYVNCYGLN